MTAGLVGRLEDLGWEGDDGELVLTQLTREWRLSHPEAGPRVAFRRELHRLVVRDVPRGPGRAVTEYGVPATTVAGVVRWLTETTSEPELVTYLDVVAALLACSGGLPAAAVADASDSSVSTAKYRLGLLVEAGLVRTVKRGRRLRYHVALHLVGLPWTDIVAACDRQGFGPRRPLRKADDRRTTSGRMEGLLDRLEVAVERVESVARGETAEGPGRGIG